MGKRNTNSSANDGVLGSPLRNLAAALGFVVLVYLAATVGYILAGWSPGDAAYMVTLTIFSVGYEEVQPVNSEYLRILTSATIVLGCTGMIVLTGALIQVFTVFQIRRMLGLDRMHTQIDKLQDHVIICGFGRIGVQLARELQVAHAGFVIIERDPGKIAEAKSLGFLHVNADATDEGALRAAGIERARVLATVLPDDAANVFITLSARNLNSELQIIARGEVPSTENKLYHAGADKVVLPTHIGAERIAEIILYPSTERFLQDSQQLHTMQRGLHDLGLKLEVVKAADNGAMTGLTVGDAERIGQGAYFIVQIDRGNGQSLIHPGEVVRIEGGDTIVLMIRDNHVSAGAVFSTARGRVGRMGT